MSFSGFSDWFDGMRVVTDRAMANALPDAALALVILGVGWLVAVLCDVIVRRVVSRLGDLGRVLALGDANSVIATQAKRSAGLIGRAVRWLVLLVFVIIAAEAVGLAAITGWLTGVVAFVPRIFAAIFIGFAALIAGRIARSTVTRSATTAGLPQAGRFGRLVQIAVVVPLGLVALDQLGIEIAFLVGALEIVLAALLGGAALAFGLGARTTVENVLAAHYLRKSYEVGQVVRLGSHEGRIVSIDATHVVVAAAAGETSIPARKFSLIGTTKLRPGDEE